MCAEKGSKDEENAPRIADSGGKNGDGQMMAGYGCIYGCMVGWLFLFLIAAQSLAVMRAYALAREPTGKRMHDKLQTLVTRTKMMDG